MASFKDICIINQEIDNKTKIPIILIDNSGSTSSYIRLKIIESNILKAEVEVIKNKLLKEGYEKCYLMFWDTHFIRKDEAINISDITNVYNQLQVKPSGGTDISVALHNILEDWYQKNTDIYILTDGQIQSPRYDLKQQIFNLSKKNVNINIITLEDSNYNYNINNVNAGSELYNVIQRNKLVKYIRQFICFNNYHIEEPFINFLIPEVNNDEFSYMNYKFKKENLDGFIEILSNIIETNKNNEIEINKIIYNLSITIYQITKNKSPKIKSEIINMFISLFVNTINYDVNKIKSELETEMKNHEEGVSATFQQYKENRNKLFERTQDELYNNVQETFHNFGNFISIPINQDNNEDNKMIIFKSNKLNSFVRLGDRNYNKGAISYNNYSIPMFSINTINTEQAEQSIRQWIRAIYSKIHRLQVNDDKITYLVLTDMMSVIFSDIQDKEIKNGYKNLGRIMLNQVRFNSGGIKQIMFLKMHSKPQPLIGNKDSMTMILNHCNNHFNNNKILSNDELWYGICYAFDDKEIINKQIPKTINKDQLIRKIKENNKKYDIKEYKIEDEYDYYDYITHEDTSKTGGYVQPEYKIGNIKYKSSFVISETTYNKILNEDNGIIKCPITNLKLNINSYVKIPPKIYNNTNNDINNINYNERNNEIKIKLEVFDTTKYKKIRIEEEREIDKTYRNTDDLDWINSAYEFDKENKIITEKLYKEKEKNISNEDFNREIKSKMDYIEKIDMKNIVLGGNVCKNIILDESIGFIDCYIYDTDKISETIQRFINQMKEHMKNTTVCIVNKYEFDLIEVYFLDNQNKRIKRIKRNRGNRINRINRVNIVKKINKLQELKGKNCKLKLVISTKKYNTISEIENNNDVLNVLWDGKILYFRNDSYISYKYNITVPKIFNTKLYKLYKSGFRYLINNHNIINPDQNNQFTVNNLTFNINVIEHNYVFLNSLTNNIIDDDNNIDNNDNIYNNDNNDNNEEYILEETTSINKLIRCINRMNKKKVKKTTNTISQEMINYFINNNDNNKYIDYEEEELFKVKINKKTVKENIIRAYYKIIQNTEEFIITNYDNGYYQIVNNQINYKE